MPFTTASKNVGEIDYFFTLQMTLITIISVLLKVIHLAPLGRIQTLKGVKITGGGTSKPWYQFK